MPVVHTFDQGNCGGRCILHAQVEDGRIIRLATDTPEDADGGVPLRACPRGLRSCATFFGSDRLRYPQKRVGERGEGRFERISWDEAIDVIACEWTRIRDAHGPGSRYVNYSSGVRGIMRGDHLAKRLLGLDGGFLDYYNSYSSACIRWASEAIYGTGDTGSSLDTLLQSEFIILWGHNPAWTIFDAGTMFYLRKARDAGVPIVVVDPRRNETVKALGAEWVPIRPATDSAMLEAMAYVIFTEGLHDQGFLDRCCLGFDEGHLPAGYAGPSVREHLLGHDDGIPKTPEWAASICGVPAELIRDLARRYAQAKPAALIQGYGPQRHAMGEQNVRGAILLACMTGNVGVRGGWAAGTGAAKRHAFPKLPAPPNPYGRKIPCFRWTDALDHGPALGARDGVVAYGDVPADCGPLLESGIKMIVNIAGNSLVNQHGDINRTTELLRDTSKCEFILCSDVFLTTSARFADILLPGVSQFEVDNIVNPWYNGDFIGFGNKAVEPLGEARPDYEWLAEVAARLGLRDEFTLGRTRGEWLRALYEDVRAAEPELPPFEEFKAAGVYRFAPRSEVAFQQEARNPQEHPFPTPSGRIELVHAVGEGAKPQLALPCYVRPAEGADDPLAARYPLQLVGYHTIARTHSTHATNAGLAKLDPQRLWMNPADAAARGVADGCEVRAFNDRGEVRIPVRVTDAVMPGVVALSQGAWWDPDAQGVDHGGSINVLTSYACTPLAFGNAQHTALVQVARI